VIVDQLKRGLRERKGEERSVSMKQKGRGTIKIQRRIYFSIRG